ITDFNAYNARILRANLTNGASWSMDSQFTMGDGFLGMNWVGDLAVECDVDVAEARGELALDLVEAGYHFRATINLVDGKCAVTILDGRTGKPLGFNADGETGLKTAGKHQLRLANVDDQILLWVDGDLVKLST